MQHARGTGGSHSEDGIPKADARHGTAAPVRQLAHATGMKAHQLHVYVLALVQCLHINVAAVSW